MTVSSFVVAFKRLRLNQPVVSPVYDQYSVLAVMEDISRHWREYYTEERRSENTVLFYALRYWEVFWLVSVMSRTLTIMPSWNCRTVVMNLLGQQNFSFVFHKPSLLTVSKALVKSAKVTRRSLFCSWHFSLQSWWKQVCRITGEAWTEPLSLVEDVCGISFVLNTSLHINLLEQSEKKKGHGIYSLFSAFIPWYLTLNGLCSACLQAVMNIKWCPLILRDDLLKGVL